MGVKIQSAGNVDVTHSEIRSPLPCSRRMLACLHGAQKRFFVFKIEIPLCIELSIRLDSKLMPVGSCCPSTSNGSPLFLDQFFACRLVTPCGERIEIHTARARWQLKRIRHYHKVLDIHNTITIEIRFCFAKRIRHYHQILNVHGAIGIDVGCDSFGFR